MKSTKKGRLLYEELVRPMEFLAHYMKSLPPEKFNAMREMAIKSWIEVLKRKGKVRVK